MTNEKVLHANKDERGILNTIKISKANWISHILHRNSLLKHIIKGRIGEMEVTGRRRKQRKQLLTNLRKLESIGNSSRKHSVEDWL
jgi:hypothetical protein